MFCLSFTTRSLATQVLDQRSSNTITRLLCTQTTDASSITTEGRCESQSSCHCKRSSSPSGLLLTKVVSHVDSGSYEQQINQIFTHMVACESTCVFVRADWRTSRWATSLGRRSRQRVQLHRQLIQEGRAVFLDEPAEIAIFEAKTAPNFPELPFSTVFATKHLSLPLPLCEIANQHAITIAYNG